MDLNDSIFLCKNPVFMSIRICPGRGDTKWYHHNPDGHKDRRNTESSKSILARWFCSDRGTPSTEKGSQSTPPTLDSIGTMNRRYSYEPCRVKTRRLQRVVSSPNLVSSKSTTGRPMSHEFEYGSSGLYHKLFRSYKVVWHSGSRDGWSMT